MARKFRHLSKKEKKKLLYKKNRAHEQMYQLVRQRRVEAARVKDEDSKSKPRKRDKRKKEKEWSAKVSKVRNRLTGKKRESKERWNRFAGTSGGGGRGM